MEESELIITRRGAMYHLDLRPEEIGSTILLVGDPDRVAMVSKHFDHIDVQRQHREFVTHTGRLGKQCITALSTGIGTDNIDIVLTELDALANIDLTHRRPKEQRTQLRFIRIGTSGSLQSGIPVGAVVVSTAAIGFDNMAAFYRLPYDDEEKAFQSALARFLQEHDLPPACYIAFASLPVLNTHRTNQFPGITITCPGFYGPQGRRVRLQPAYPSFLDKLAAFAYCNQQCTNLEMETAGIYALARLLGHQAISYSAIIANRVDKKFSADPQAVVTKLIADVLEDIDRCSENLTKPDPSLNSS